MEEFYNYTKKVFTELSSPDNQRELDRIINSTCGNLMTRLSDENLNLTERERIIRCFATVLQRFILCSP